jgi:hypothetical protein
MIPCSMYVFLKTLLPSFLLILLCVVAQAAAEGVTFNTTTHRLYYVPSVNEIAYTAVGVPAADYQDVNAYELQNSKGVRIKVIAQGATLVELSLLDGGDGVSRTNYLWDNIEGATYYGQNSNNFPLRRGMIVNGGARFTAVAPEHGLYYDIDWDVSVHISEPDQKSIVLTMVDNEENRNRASNHVPLKPTNQDKPTGLSGGQFSRDGQDMSRYPTTDMEFKLSITLRDDEDFVRLRMSVTNPDEAAVKWGEAWLPMLFPITEDSVILSRQKSRWRRDSWCLDQVVPNIVEWADYSFLHKPLDWPMGCIFYDLPSMQGNFHGVTTVPAEGKGVVYYSPEDSEHYTKMWSWGKQGAEGNTLDGRPASSYYEPWSGSTNFAFFQTRAFQPQTELSWEIAILPISGGLTSEKGMEELLEYVETHIEDRMDHLGDIQGHMTRNTVSNATYTTVQPPEQGNATSPPPVLESPGDAVEGITAQETSSAAAIVSTLTSGSSLYATKTALFLLSSFGLMVGFDWQSC